MRVIIVGAGIGGLATALALHQVGITNVVCIESAQEIRPLGVGINLLPHATRELAALGLEADLGRVAIATSDATFFNRFGQLIYQEPLGLAAGYEHPQFSIHRGDLQMVLLDAFVARAGRDRLTSKVTPSSPRRAARKRKSPRSTCMSGSGSTGTTGAIEVTPTTWPSPTSTRACTSTGTLVPLRGTNSDRNERGTLSAPSVIIWLMASR